jgi:hypothetical protein
MIRFTWMQARTQTVVAIAGLAIVAVVLALTGPHLVHLYDSTVANCQANGDCSAASSAFLRNDHALQIGLNVLVVVIPCVIGLFWGAPLVAEELEAGTFRFAWTQNVTRARWLAVKLGVIGLASAAVAGLLSLMATWWSSPIDRVHLSAFSSFDYRDVVPIGYAVFAFTLGVTAGIVIRRTLPAMTSTLVLFVFIRLAVTHWVRPHLVSPVTADIALNPTTTGYGASGDILLMPFGAPTSTLQPAPPSLPNSWITSIQIVGRSGNPLTARYLKSKCPTLGSGGGGGGRSHGPVPASVRQALQDCVAKIGKTFHERVTYQPASRYWVFQWYELAIYLGAALVLAGLSIWWVRRRLT